MLETVRYNILKLGWDVARIEVPNYIFSKQQQLSDSEDDAIDQTIFYCKRLGIITLSSRKFVKNNSSLIKTNINDYISSDQIFAPTINTHILNIEDRFYHQYLLGQFGYYQSVLNRLIETESENIFDKYLMNYLFERAIDKLFEADLEQETNILLELLGTYKFEESDGFIYLLEKYVLDKDSVLMNPFGNMLIRKSVELQESLFVSEKSFLDILPQEDTFANWFSEISILFLPHSVIGGDFYYAKSTSDKFMFFSGDCQGHGIEGALEAMKADRIIEETVIKNPSRIGADFISQFYLNRFFHAAKHNTAQKNYLNYILNGYNLRAQNSDSIDSSEVGADLKPQINKLECSVFHILKNENKIVFTGLQHEILLYSNGFFDHITTIRSSSLIDEIIEGKFNPIEYTVDIKAGDTIFMFTDGFIDQIGGSRKKKLGSQVFYLTIDYLLKLSKKNLSQFTTLLEAFLIYWRDFMYCNHLYNLYELDELSHTFKHKLDEKTARKLEKKLKDIEQIIILINYQLQNGILNIEKIKRYSIHKEPQCDDISFYCFKI
jgi:hypothetical protein